MFLNTIPFPTDHHQWPLAHLLAYASAARPTNPILSFHFVKLEKTRDRKEKDWWEGSRTREDYQKKMPSRVSFSVRPLASPISMKWILFISWVGKKLINNFFPYKPSAMAGRVSFSVHPLASPISIKWILFISWASKKLINNFFPYKPSAMAGRVSFSVRPPASPTYPIHIIYFLLNQQLLIIQRDLF